MKEILQATSFSFARSSGPGGQNVNKVETKVLAICDIYKLNLSDSKVSMLKTKLENKLVEEQFLHITEQSTRSQLKNKELAIKKLEKLIEKALKPIVVRKGTKPSAAAVAKRMVEKKRNSEIKKLRAKPL